MVALTMSAAKEILLFFIHPFQLVNTVKDRMTLLRMG